MHLLKKDFKVFLNNKLLIGIWIVLAIGLSIGFSAEFKTSTESTGAVIGVCNNDGDNKYSNMLVEFFEKNDNFKSLMRIVKADEETLMEMFNKKELDCYVVIPKGFMDKIIEIEPIPVKVRISDDNSVTSIMVRNVLNSYEIYVSSVQNNITALSDGMKKLNMKKTDRLFINTSMSIELITTVLGKEAFFDYEYVDAYATVDMRNSILYAVACMIISFGALFAGVDLLKEKSYGVINRYKAGGGSVIRLVANKLVFYTVVIYSLILIPNVIGSLVKKSSVDITMMLLYLLIVVFSLSSSMLIATVTGKIRTYVLVGNMFTICTYLVGGGIIPATYLPENMLKLSKFTPAYSFIQMLIKVSCDMPVSMFKTVIITYTFITIGCAVLSGYILKRKEA